MEHEHSSPEAKPSPVGPSASDGLPPRAAHGAHLHVDTLRDITAEPVRWLWANHLPLRKLVVLDGFPGQGKSTLMLDVAARLSMASGMPDGTSAGDPADTLIVTGEDGAADTIRPRLEAAGADLARTHHVSGVTRTPGGRLLPLSLPADMDALVDCLRTYPHVRLVVIDPYASVLGTGVDAREARRNGSVPDQLARLAADANVCVVIVRHLRKSPGRNPLTAGGGVMGIVGSARVGMLVDQHPDDPCASVLAMHKNNLGERAPSLWFRRHAATVSSESGIPVETLRLEWMGETPISGEELLKAREEAGGPNTSNAAVVWIRDILRHGARIDRKAIMKAGEGAGFHPRMLDRAANRLGIVRVREGFGLKCQSFWQLPVSSPTPTSDIGPTSDNSETVSEVEESVRTGEFGSAVA